MEHSKDRKKQILTSLGTVSFKKTIVRDKATKKQACSLLDKKVGLTAHQKTTDEVVTRIAEAAVLNSYECAGSRAVLNGETLSRQTAMNKVRGIVIPDQTAIDDSKQIEIQKKACVFKITNGNTKGTGFFGLTEFPNKKCLKLYLLAITINFIKIQ